MSARKRLLAKIRALLQKTVDNGCTEAEAMAALDLARRLMDEHEVSETEVADGEAIQTETVQKSDRNNVRNYLAPAVGRFCGCRSWTDGGRETIVFCGLESSTVFAHWLLDTLEAFVLRELAAYLRRTWTPQSPSVRRVESNSFVIGCAGRIVRRLDELTPKPAPGRGLVVQRYALIDAFMKARGIRLRYDPLGRRGAADDRATQAGWDAGKHAQFNKPVGDGDEPRAIGGTVEW
jgi:Protein of unknown function (DUF2786)